IAHIGGRCTKMDEPHALDSCDRNGEAMQYLEKLPAGTIDAFFAGHTHANMAHYVNGVPTVQGLPMSREFSTVELWIDTEKNRVTKSEIRPHTMICSFVYEGTNHCDPRTAPKGARLVPRTFAGQTIQPDARVAATLDPYLRRVAAKRDEKLGIRSGELFVRNYSAESPLGNLIADALRRSTGADVALMNSGGIRSELPRGDLTYGDLFAVSPFDNYPAMVIMTGAQLIEVLRNTTTGARGIMQVSGIKYTFDASKKGLERFVGATLDDGRPLEPEKLYSVIMPDFIAMGGDGADAVMNAIPKDRITIHYAAPLRDVLVAELKKLNGEPLEPKVEGRIRVLNAPAR
ncbi:MAG TPA: 5'-nucleotidase C-terminal domain-containing protein, partial [Thermoanaerobaculia bacterium]